MPFLTRDCSRNARTTQFLPTCPNLCFCFKNIIWSVFFLHCFLIYLAWYFPNLCFPSVSPLFSVIKSSSPLKIWDVDLSNLGTAQVVFSWVNMQWVLQHTKDGLKNNKEASSHEPMLQAENGAVESCDNWVCTLIWTDKIADAVQHSGRIWVACKYVLL